MLDVAPRIPTLNPGETIDGRYRIVRALADGGMSTVYLAEHMLIKRRVAIKLLRKDLAADASMLKMFMTEARAAGTLGHPNIVESTDMGFTRTGLPYIVYEYVEGALLAEEIYRVGGMPPRRALRIAIQIASALDAAHQAGIVHLDLKSDNVILTDADGVADRVKVLDFGIAKLMTPDAEKTQRNLVMGTPAFMAPEQVTAPETVDERADIYALGVVLYEMLEARRPFANTNAQILLHRLVNEAPEPLQRPNIPPALNQLIFDKLLAKDRTARCQSMAEVQAALEEIEALLRAVESVRLKLEVPIEDPYDDVSVEPARPVRRARLGWLAAAAVAALAGGGLRFAEQRVESSTDDADQTALRADAAKIAATLEAEAHEATARAAGIAASPLLRAAIETDRATVQDLLQDGRLPLRVAPGETIELFQLHGGDMTSLMRLPETAAAIAPGPDTRLVPTSAGMSLVVSAPIAAPSSAIGGSLAIARAVDLQFISRIVAEDAAQATLTGVGAPIRITGGDKAVIDGVHVTVPIVLRRDIASGDLALAATIVPVQRGTTLRLGSNIGLACSGVLVLIFGLSWSRRRRAT